MRDGKRKKDNRKEKKKTQGEKKSKDHERGMFEHILLKK